MKTDKAAREMHRLIQNKNTLAMNIHSLESAILKGEGLLDVEVLDIGELECVGGKKYAIKIITTRRVALLPIP